MKLWQAMLLGAKRGPQLFGTLFDDKGGSCAMGAIHIATGGRKRSFPLEIIFPELKNQSACPIGPCESFTMDNLQISNSPQILLEVIIHLNNDHRWSRQRIAEWLTNRELKFKPIVLVERIKVKESV